MGRYLSPRYARLLLVSGYPVLTAVNSSQHGCALSGCTWAPEILSIARKCEIKRWFPRGADGQRWSAYGHVITKFSRMDRFSWLWGPAHTRARSAGVELRH